MYILLLYPLTLNKKNVFPEDDFLNSMIKFTPKGHQVNIHPIYVVEGEHTLEPLVASQILSKNFKNVLNPVLICYLVDL